MLSTVHDSVTKVKRERKNSRPTSTNGANIRKHFEKTQVRKEVEIPEIVDDYNYGKGGVNLADKFRAAYFTQQTSCRTWLPLFCWLLDAIITNAFLIMRATQGSTTRRQLSHKDFRLFLAVWLMTSQSELAKSPGDATTAAKQISHALVGSCRYVLQGKTHKNSEL